MATIRFRSPVTKPLLPKGTPKPVPPDPRAYDTFRVTQQFDDVNPNLAINPNRLAHRATDIGNFRCGDPVVSMAPGTIRRVKDSAGALGVVIDHGAGVTTEMWHLNGYAGPSSGPVVSGQQVGVVGKTGLGAVCHVHVEAKRDGVRFDPEPLMFGGSLTIEEDNMRMPIGQPIAQGTVGPGNRLRVDPFTTEGSRVIGGEPPDGIGEAKAYLVNVFMLGVKGQPYTLGGKAGDEYAWVGVFGQTWYVAEPLVTDLKPSSIFPPADCSAQEATIAQLQTKIARATTANSGAQRAQDAVAAALR